MIRLIRTNSQHPDFISLVSKLDADLAIRDGEDHAFYAQYNKINRINEVVVAYLGEIPVGCGAIKSYSDGVAEVKRMFTDPMQRGKGIASAILKELEVWALELNFHKCILETGIKQPEAIALYRKNAYLPIPNYGQYEGISTSVCFEKVLSKNV